MSDLDRMVKLNARADEYLERYNDKANTVVLAAIPIVFLLVIAGVAINGFITLLGMVF